MALDRKQAFHDILAGEGTVPHLTSAWQHFVHHEYGVEEQVRAHADFVTKWDWDWIKINPRSAYYTEAWGGVFDHDDYGNGRSPKLITPPVKQLDDLRNVDYVDPETSAALSEETGIVRGVHQAFPDRVVLQTVFSPLTVLLGLAALPRINHRAIYGHEPTLSRDELLYERPDEAKRALNAIARTLADYVEQLVAPVEQGGAGADGIFYAVTGTASRQYFDHEHFTEFSEPYDRIVLQAAGSSVKLLHTCKEYSNPEWFTDYPIDLLQWDSFVEGNPPVTDAYGSVPVSGPDAALIGKDGDLQELSRQLAVTTEARAGKPFLLAPSCTIPPNPGDENLRLLRQA
jgi:uroporphyrinogen decarboxylase